MEEKKNNLTWCTSCCQWVGIGEPHTCYDEVSNILEDYSRELLSRQEVYEIFKNISARTRVYRDFTEGGDG